MALCHDMIMIYVRIICFLVQKIFDSTIKYVSGLGELLRRAQTTHHLGHKTSFLRVENIWLSEIASCASCAAMTYPMKIQPCAFWMEVIVDHLEAHRFLQ